ncbi:MAG: hypothetical protein ACREPR_02485, partial [Brasilonema sp.]
AWGYLPRLYKASQLKNHFSVVNKHERFYFCIHCNFFLNNEEFAIKINIKSVSLAYVTSFDIKKL